MLSPLVLLLRILDLPFLIRLGLCLGLFHFIVSASFNFGFALFGSVRSGSFNSVGFALGSALLNSIGSESIFGSSIAVHSTRPALPHDIFVEPSPSLPHASVEMSIWYLDSGATNHVCQEAFVLNNSSEYSSKIPLLMGNGTCAHLAHLGHSTISTSCKLLHITNVLHVPTIRKKILSISQFAQDNNVFSSFTHFIVL